MLRDNKDKIPANLNSEAEAKIKAVKEALKGTDINAIKSATQALNETMQKIGQAVYQQQQPPPAGRNSRRQGDNSLLREGERGGKDEGTVEGEFREV